MTVTGMPLSKEPSMIESYKRKTDFLSKNIDEGANNYSNEDSVGGSSVRESHHEDDGIQEEERIIDNQSFDCVNKDLPVARHVLPSESCITISNCNQNHIYDSQVEDAMRDSDTRDRILGNKIVLAVDSGNYVSDNNIIDQNSSKDNPERDSIKEYNTSYNTLSGALLTFSCRKDNDQRTIIYIGVFVITIAIVILIFVFSIKNDGSQNNDDKSTLPTPFPTPLLIPNSSASFPPTPITTVSERHGQIMEAIEGFADIGRIPDPGSDQHKAFSYLLTDDSFPNNVEAYSKTGGRLEKELAQLYTLATLYYSLNADDSIILSDNDDFKLNELKDFNCLTNWNEIVECEKDEDEFHVVVSLNLERYGLTGSIPKDIGGLSHLRELRINDNRIRGSIPETLSSLTKLQFLQLAGNELTGTIPNDMFCSPTGLSIISFLYLNDNDLEGAIPFTFTDKCEFLRDVNFSKNRFNGTLLPSPSTDIHQLLSNSMPRLKRLDVHDNRLTGTIPSTEIINNVMPDLQSFCTRGNNFTGNQTSTIPCLTTSKSRTML